MVEGGEWGVRDFKLKKYPIALVSKGSKGSKGSRGSRGSRRRKNLLIVFAINSILTID
jgi:hypothetical protein